MLGQKKKDGTTGPKKIGQISQHRQKARQKWKLRGNGKTTTTANGTMHVMIADPLINAGKNVNRTAKIKIGFKVTFTRTPTTSQLKKLQSLERRRKE